MSCICSRADGATAGSRSPSQVRNKRRMIGHVAQRGVTPRTAHRTWARQCPAVTPRPTDGLDFSEVRTCKAPPTHRCAACHGSATRLRSGSLPSDPYSPRSGEPLSPFEVELYAARFRGTPGACTPARSYLSPGQELPSAAGLYEHCSPYPPRRDLPGAFGLPTHLLHLSRPFWSSLPRAPGGAGGGRQKRSVLVAHIRVGIGSNTGVGLGGIAEGLGR